MSILAREIHLKSRPPGLPAAQNFALVKRQLDAPAEGQLLVRNLWMSVDPYMRGRMADRPSYIEPFQIDQALEGSAVGIVEQSRDAKFKVGDVVSHFTGWRDYALVDAATANAIDDSRIPTQAYLGVLGIPGMTAYAAMTRIGEPKAGETVFVSAAAGAVGIVVCQFAKIKGCRVVGSVGSEEKAKWLREEIGVDAVINYKTCGDLAEAMAKACPNGIDIYFDNVGGQHLQVALTLANKFARIPLVGMIEQYNDEKPPPGPSSLVMAIGKNIKLQGLLILDHMDILADFFRDMPQWIAQGKMKSRETVVDGLENAPKAFIGLFKGENIGKMLVKIGEK